MLLLDHEKRTEVWQHLIAAIEEYIARVDDLPVTPEIDLPEIRSMLSSIDFAKPSSSFEAINFAVEGLTKYQVHTPHTGYFGLFNPAPTTMGIVADALVAAFNPQLAAWSHSPFANEVENHLVRAFGAKFGYDRQDADGTFTSGGSEANHTALLAALNHAFPEISAQGLRGLAAQPVFYVSAESHHSFLKAARMSGLGHNAVRVVPVDDSSLRMDLKALGRSIEQDRANGFQPFMIVATVGTTNSGIIDPLPEMAQLAAHQKVWLHADAAWGGAGAFVPELRELFTGIELADSITFDAHKWLSVPMGAGIFLTRHRDILTRAFKTDNAYMPQREGEEIIDPYSHSMTWSRRFTGLKVFLSLLVAGWEGYETVLRHQTAMGEFLRQELEANDWKVVNTTKLPVVCFVDSKQSSSPVDEEAHLRQILEKVWAGGKAWISVTRLGNKQFVLRACITNYRTQEQDVRMVVETLNQAREQLNPENQKHITTHVGS